MTSFWLFIKTELDSGFDSKNLKSKPEKPEIQTQSEKPAFFGFGPLEGSNIQKKITFLDM